MGGPIEYEMYASESALGSINVLGLELLAMATPPAQMIFTFPEAAHDQLLCRMCHRASASP
jgi:hypothetical protein